MSVESIIRNLFVGFIVDKSKDLELSQKDVQIRFKVLRDGIDLDCRYELLLDYKFKDELSFSDISGFWYANLRDLIEGFVKQLFSILNESENIDINKLRIIIASDSENTKKENIQAYLYNEGKFIRKVEVSEFVTNE